MKFLTSSDIRISSNTKYACLDLRVKKSPKLSDLFKIENAIPGQKSTVGSAKSSKDFSNGESL